jgi:hypothetical protein
MNKGIVAQENTFGPWRSRTLWRGILRFGFTAAVRQVQDDSFAVAFFAVVFVEDWFGDYILFAGPISQVAFAASIAAKGKIRMYRGIGGGLTYWALVFHLVLPGL